MYNIQAAFLNRKSDNFFYWKLLQNKNYRSDAVNLKVLEHSCSSLSICGRKNVSDLGPFVWISEFLKIKLPKINSYYTFIMFNAGLPRSYSCWDSYFQYSSLFPILTIIYSLHKILVMNQVNWKNMLTGQL